MVVYDHEKLEGRIEKKPNLEDVKQFIRREYRGIRNSDCGEYMAREEGKNDRRAY
jgi:hypothetical protein